jgi:putative ABC transport system permease protein
VLDEAIEGIGYLTLEPGFEAEDYLSARVVLDEPGAAAESDERSASESRFGDVVGELMRRLDREPGVAGVTFGTRLPGQEQPKATIEVEGRAARGDDAMADEVRTLSVGTDFFEVLGAPMLAGRPFGAGDAEPDANVVLVSRSFVESVLEGGNAIGKRLRYATPESEPSGAWHEVVGVVEDLAPNPINPGEVEARVYHLASLESLQGLSLVVAVRPGSEALGPRLRTIAAGVDPGLRLYDVLTLDEVALRERRGLQVFYTALGLAALSVVLLTTLGAYALMSFTVAQRRREIGIRAALGAEPRRLLLSIFARALRQLALGAVVGFALALGLHAAAPQGLFMPERGPLLLLAVAALMMGIGVIATIGPARRGLAIQPTEALGEG